MSFEDFMLNPLFKNIKNNVREDMNNNKMIELDSNLGEIFLIPERANCNSFEIGIEMGIKINGIKENSNDSLIVYFLKCRDLASR